MLVVKTFINDKHLLLVDIGQMGWVEQKKCGKMVALSAIIPYQPWDLILCPQKSKKLELAKYVASRGK